MPEPKLRFYPLDDQVTAFSTTRHGGVSKGNYASFNVNNYCGDDPKAIAQNKTSLCKLLDIQEDHLVMPHQVHGTAISQIGRTFFMMSEDARKTALEGVDALMTNLPGVCIGVSTADCIPIIIFDAEHHAACVVHAGWRGTVQRITRAAIVAMITAYHSRPEDLKAVIGPGISLKNFEVGDEVYQQFSEASFPMEHIARQEEKWHIDLWEANRIQLHGAGLLPENILLSKICTFDDVEDYFSARRLGINSGRILTGIVIK